MSGDKMGGLQGDMTILAIVIVVVGCIFAVVGFYVLDRFVSWVVERRKK
jgi:hypothetical protein